MSGEDPRITAAYARAALAYDIARAEVYARYPHVVPPRERLSRRERELLDDLERQNATLDQLRRERIAARHVGAGEGAADALPGSELPVDAGERLSSAGG